MGHLANRHGYWKRCKSKANLLVDSEKCGAVKSGDS